RTAYRADQSPDGSFSQSSQGPPLAAGAPQDGRAAETPARLHSTDGSRTVPSADRRPGASPLIGLRCAVAFDSIEPVERTGGSEGKKQGGGSSMDLLVSSTELRWYRPDSLSGR